MTLIQYTKKVVIARRTGSALMPDGCELLYRGNNEFSLYDQDGNCVEVSRSGASKLAYLFT